MILIYTDKITNRLAYTLDTVFKGILRSDYKITSDKIIFQHSDLPKLSYTNTPIADEIFIKSSTLLFEKDIEPQTIQTRDLNGIRLIFAHDFLQSNLPFDPFAAIFYLISRYEEYLPSKKDQHGRFDALNSIAYKEGFLETPVVDYYALFIRQLFIEKYPELPLPKRKFRFTPTFDIDNAFAYLHKGFWRGFFAIIKNVLSLEFKALGKRISVLNRKQKDPYDSFEWMKDIHKKYKLRPILFFLLGDYGKFDKNIPHDKEIMNELINDCSGWADIGIHPSYHTPLLPNKLKGEIKRLNLILNQITTRSRQHFLRLMMPTAYRNLLQSSILEDYTMGYAPLLGFRASTCTPFYFFDIEKDERSLLKIHPFCFMDSTLMYYMMKDEKVALEKITQFIEEIDYVGGTFVTLFHNETFVKQEWKNLYEKILKQTATHLGEEEA